MVVSAAVVAAAVVAAAVVAAAVVAAAVVSDVVIPVVVISAVVISAVVISVVAVIDGLLKAFTFIWSIILPANFKGLRNLILIKHISITKIPGIKGLCQMGNRGSGKGVPATPTENF